MLFADLPGARLLYGSDAIQPLRRGGFFMLEYLYGVRDAVRRNHLDVEGIFGRHAPPTPWSAIEAALSSAAASSAPGGQ